MRREVLVLGSMPGAASLARTEYYGHPRNAFWPIMGALFGAGPELPYAERTARLTAAGVQCELHLWDGQIHDFPLAAAVLPEGRRAIRYIGDFVKHVTTESQQDVPATEYPTAL